MRILARISGEAMSVKRARSRRIDRGKSEGATPSTNEALPQKVTSLIDSFKERKKKTNT